MPSLAHMVIVDAIALMLLVGGFRKFWSASTPMMIPNASAGTPSCDITTEIHTKAAPVMPGILIAIIADEVITARMSDTPTLIP